MLNFFRNKINYGKEGGGDGGESQSKRNTHHHTQGQYDNNPVNNTHKINGTEDTPPFGGVAGKPQYNQVPKTNEDDVADKLDTFTKKENLINQVIENSTKKLIKKFRLDENIDIKKGNKGSQEMSIKDTLRSLLLKGKQNKYVVKSDVKEESNKDNFMAISGKDNFVFSSLSYGLIKVKGNNNIIIANQGQKVIDSGKNNLIVCCNEITEEIKGKISKFEGSAKNAALEFIENKNKINARESSDNTKNISKQESKGPAGRSRAATGSSSGRSHADSLSRRGSGAGLPSW